MTKKKILNLKVKIYALVDPRDDRIFYVGVTRKELLHRLQSHIHTKRGSYSGNNKKCDFIQDMRKEGFAPKIELLEEIPMSIASEVEFFYYDLLSYFGFELIQSPKFDYVKGNLTRLAY